MHDHGHHSPGNQVSRKLIAAAIATILFVFAELAVGLYANSLALVGDSFHNFTDAIALGIALFAIHLEKRPPTYEKSFGYQRAGILAAFINSGILIALTVFIFREAILRFREPHPVNSFTMMITAAVAVVLNAAITIALRSHGRDDVNIRSAVLHMLGDAVSSARHHRRGRPDRHHGLSAMGPCHLHRDRCADSLEQLGHLERDDQPAPGRHTCEHRSRGGHARDCSDRRRGRSASPAHLGACSSRPALSCHLMVGDVPVRSTAHLLDELTTMLQERYRIVHSTVQFEFAECGDEDPHCVPVEQEMDSRL